MFIVAVNMESLGSLSVCGFFSGYWWLGAVLVANRKLKQDLPEFLLQSVQVMEGERFIISDKWEGTESVDRRVFAKKS